MDSVIIMPPPVPQAYPLKLEDPDRNGAHGPEGYLDLVLLLNAIGVIKG